MSRFRKAARWLDSKPWVSSVMIPTFVALPPSLVAGCDFYLPLKLWLEKHYYVQFVAIFWPVLIIPMAMGWSNLKQPVSVSVNQLTIFLRILAQIVGKKVERFHGFRNAHGQKQTIDPKKIFDSITQPDEQLKEIIRGVWTYFELTKQDSSIQIKVALAKMGSDHISKFECVYPSDKGQRFPIKELQRADACFSQVKASRKIIVIEDSEAEGQKYNRRFVTIKGEMQDEEKSAICFPVIEPDENSKIDFVLSICASKPMHFKESEKDAYSLVLGHFSQRILLEVFLRDIKVKAR